MSFVLQCVSYLCMWNELTNDTVEADSVQDARNKYDHFFTSWLKVERLDQYLGLPPHYHPPQIKIGNCTYSDYMGGGDHPDSVGDG